MTPLKGAFFKFKERCGSRAEEGRSRECLSWSDKGVSEEEEDDDSLGENKMAMLKRLG